VKCDCGEKTHVCTYTKETELKDICCCTHGGRCNCALKKEHLDPVPESDSDDACSSVPVHLPSRPRAQTAQSDGINLTVFTNGHHKPAHKHNQMAHKCGLPYSLPRTHSNPSSSSLPNHSVESLPHTNTIDALHSESQIKDSMVSAQQEQRQVKSEHNSPAIGSTNLDQLNSQLPPLDLSSLENMPDGSFGFFDGFPTMPELDQPIFSAGISAPAVDWSHYDGLLDFNNDNFATSEFSQAPSFTGFDYSSIDQPGLTTSTSGEISEVEDFGPMSEPGGPVQSSLAKHQFGSDYNSDFGDVDGYRLSTASSYMSMPQSQMLASRDSSSLDIDDLLKGCTSSDGYIRTDTSVIGGGLSAAHRNESKHYLPNTPSFDDVNFVLPPLPLDEDCLWMTDYSPSTMPMGRNGLEVHDSGFWNQ